MKKFLESLSSVFTSLELSNKPKTDNSTKDAHTEHCCIRHGCKYQNNDCTVVTRQKPQSSPCEECECDGIHDLTDLWLVVKGIKQTCPHCDHVLP